MDWPIRWHRHHAIGLVPHRLLSLSRSLFSQLIPCLNSAVIRSLWPQLPRRNPIHTQAPLFNAPTPTKSPYAIDPHLVFRFFFALRCAFDRSNPSPMAARRQRVDFEDFLPLMVEKLGEEGLMEELCNGFRLLMDPRRGLITFDSLKRNAALLGLGALGDDDLRAMLREGDSDGDGALSQREFCVLMVRLSPDLMDHHAFAAGFMS
ncbi:hypothetical protein OPV22_015084 [Ensete ventricosum]|uniref:EF-hand domain-containing protein n=1 Tax=Ensete ventricosum TaxID=4639 RepID=A0AAV8RB40_ENSVE|nr:hypothetical protein OPV22_015084 [Ensete ventricosum]